MKVEITKEKDVKQHFEVGDIVLVHFDSMEDVFNLCIYLGKEGYQLRALNGKTYFDRPVPTLEDLKAQLFNYSYTVYSASQYKMQLVPIGQEYGGN